MKNVFIDGSAGTTGLKILDRLSSRSDLNLVTLPDNLRKDEGARRDALNNADVAILCLPDAASIEAVSFITNPETVVIDTSTAHRTNDNFVYGFPELSNYREQIKVSRRIANPGCHASGFISLVAPLVEKGIIPSDALLSSFSLTGYSGGGKKMIAEYEAVDRPELYDSPRMYGVSQNHKHLPEMKKVCGLANEPSFSPIVAPYFSGMEVVVPLFKDMISGTSNDIKEIYKSYYKSGLVHYIESEDAFLAANELSGYDDMEISVFGNDDRILLVSRFDNLGKGASGAAIQNLNISLGLPEDLGLNLKFGG